jgi:hypothetical protein
MRRSDDEQGLLDSGLSETDANGKLLLPGLKHYDSVPSALPTPLESVTAHAVLDAARAHLGARAVTYDSPAGERSMARTVAAFNAQTGHELTEEDGWLFMEDLKIVRGRAAPGYHADSYEDRVSYAALGAEARARAAGGG